MLAQAISKMGCVVVNVIIMTTYRNSYIQGKVRGLDSGVHNYR